MGFPLLSIILFVPLVGAIGAAFLPRLAGWGWSLFVAAVDLALCIYLYGAFVPGTAGFQFVERVPWLPNLGINYLLGVDGISVFLVGLNALLTLVAIGASYGVAARGERSREYLVLMLLLSTGMQGVFLATNVFLFYVFWELMLVPAYLLVGTYGGPRRAYAAIKFVLYTAVGSLLMLIGVIALGAFVSTGDHIPYTLDLPTLLRAGVPGDAQLLLFLAFAIAFAVKVGLFPFHSWVPDTYSEAPAAVVVLVAGVMAKTGAYGFVRFCLALFPQASHQMSGVMETLAVIGIIYFALEALVAQDFKRLLAYVSISHMCVIVLAIFALNTQGLEGAILQMVNHGILIAALFLIAAYIEARTGSRRLADFGGLATRLPWLATVFMVVALATLGLPGLNSFGGEFLAFLGAFQSNVIFGALGTLVIIPAAWYMLRFFQGVMEGPLPSGGPVAALASSTRSAKGDTAANGLDLRWGELLVLLPLLALIFYLGIVPTVVTERIQSSVNALPPVSVPAVVSGTSDVAPGAALTSTRAGHAIVWVGTSAPSATSNASATR